MSEYVITIDVAEYEQLKDAGNLLGAMRLAGVEKWDGFQTALNLYVKVKNGDIADE